MLNNCSPQSSVLNQTATSPLSRRSPFDEDAFFSPSKQKSDSHVNRGFSNSQSVRALPTVHDNVLKWFQELVFSRRLRTSLCVGAISAIKFYISLGILQLSLRSPLRSFRDVLLTSFAFSTLISTVIVASLAFFMCFALLHLFIKAEQSPQLSWVKSDTWMGFFAVLSYNMAYASLILKLSKYNVNEKPILEVVVFSTIISTIISVFRNDFELNVSGSVTQLGFMHTISGLLSFGRESVFVSSFRVSIQIVAIITTARSVIEVFSCGLSSLSYLFYISSHILCLVTISGQIFATKVLLKMVRHIIMKPIYFPLPPAYVIHTPTLEQMRTLIVALDSQDTLLKLFAFADLRRIAWTDRNRRLEVFSLSQPGGNPRNWSSVSTACLNILERIRSEIEVASNRVGQALDRNLSDISEDEFEDLDREMLMMPLKLRKQRRVLVYSSAIRQRHQIHNRPVHRPELLGQQQIGRLNNLFWLTSDQTVIVSRYDANIAVLAIESLYMFVVQSYTEDRYGVVLKDLAKIIGVMVQLTQTIDKFSRIRASNAALPSFVEATVKQIDSALQAGLLRINGTFGNHFGDLDITQEQLQTIKMVCRSDF
ncbi:nucleoporin protein Ndc1-Nup [Dictyocaulus viviparus]|uniref:Nucleoporin protein Ndc1-Nup n=1 Tax=Dictyocaulus viviparus TaxID=29172 RepID=A0A0D8YC60_DICVI|nr:nucleoporin protein Ndc1-Nup [Dictyocaulus viviparus]